MKTPLQQTLFFTVSDRLFFPGTVAAVNSILHFHPDANIVVVSSGRYNQPLTPPQQAALNHAGVRVMTHDDFDAPGRIPGAWQLKAYAASALAKECEILVGFDSDLIFCSPLDDVLALTLQDGKIRGGRDGDGVDYGLEFAPYGMDVPARNPKYTSTSIYFVRVTPQTQSLLDRWAECCNTACFGPQEEKIYDGYSDQGVFNAVLFAAGWLDKIEQLPNNLWSQHWTYWSDAIEWRGGQFLNRSFEHSAMRAFHCAGSEKFWNPAHSARIRADASGQIHSYTWFLAMLWFGRIEMGRGDPAALIAPESLHLCGDLLHFYHQVAAILPEAAQRWKDLGPQTFERMLAGTHRMMPLGGSMTAYQKLARSVAARDGKIVEVGSYLGGSALALAAALMDVSPDIISVESFLGSQDSTVDGWPLPALDGYAANTFAKFPFVRLRTLPVASHIAAAGFADGECDMVFLDGDHSTEALAADIAAWLPKVRKYGILAGDDASWPTVQKALSGLANINVDGDVWHLIA